MHRWPALGLVLVFLLTALAGCAANSSATEPAAPAPATPAPATPTAPAPAPDGNPATPRAPAAPPAAACTPGATAADLPSEPHGGVTLTPPPPGGTPERPWLGYLTVDQIGTWAGGGGVLGTVIMRKGGTATVATDEFWLRGVLMPAPPDDWYARHLKLEGAQPLQSRTFGLGDEGRFEFRVPAGQHGDALRLTVTDVRLGDGSSGDVVLNLCRQAVPAVTVSYQGPDGWQSARDHVPAAHGLTVRLTFTHDMIPETVERALRGPHDKTGRSDGEWIAGMRWIDPRTVELSADDPPPVLKLNLYGAQDIHGLYLGGGVPNLYTGEPPHAAAVDLASGQQHRLVNVPPEPVGAYLAPDGQSLIVTSQRHMAGYSSPSWQHLLFDLTTGTSRELQPEVVPGHWLPSGERVIITREGATSLAVIRQTKTGPQRTELQDLPPFDSYYLSPDGQWLAVLARTGERTPDSYDGVRFLVVSTDGKTRRTLTGAAYVWRPGKGGITLYGPAWSPDSTRLALTQPDDGGTSLVVADVAAGTLRTLARTLPGSRGSYDPVTWSPDGGTVLVGPLLLDAATGEVTGRVEGIRRLPFWSPDGRWLLHQPEDWSAIAAYNLRTGDSTDLGPGLALGWNRDGQALLLRWPGAAHRTVWGL